MVKIIIINRRKKNPAWHARISRVLSERAVEQSHSKCERVKYSLWIQFIKTFYMFIKTFYMFIKTFYMFIKTFYIMFIKTFYMFIKTFYMFIKTFYMFIKTFYMFIKTFYMFIKPFYMFIKTFYMFIKTFYMFFKTFCSSALYFYMFFHFTARRITKKELVSNNLEVFLVMQF